MTSKLPPTKDKAVLITGISTIILFIYKMIDAAGNAEFILQKIGISESVARFLGSSRGIDFCTAASFIALIIVSYYKANRYFAVAEQTANGQTFSESNPKDLAQDEAVNSIVEKNEKTSESIANSFAIYNIDAHLIQVRDKVFINEKVLLDGHSYRYCKFTNVKFVYNGTAPSEITNSVFEGRIIATENPAVDSTICVLRGLGFIKEEIAIFPAYGKPLAHINPPQNLESENK